MNMLKSNIKDEFHMKKSRDSKIISILRAFKRRMHFVLWIYSSTSFEISSDNLDHYVKILKHSDEWKNEHILKSSDSKKVLSWDKSMFNALKCKHDVQMNDELQKIARKFDRLFTLLMIQHLSSMNWFDALCIKLSSHKMQDVNCSIIEKYKKMHARLESKTARSVKEELRVHVNDWVSDDKKRSMSVFFSLTLFRSHDRWDCVLHSHILLNWRQSTIWCLSELNLFIINDWQSSITVSTMIISRNCIN